MSSVVDTDPGSAIRCLSDPWIRETGWANSQDPDPGSGSGIYDSNHIFASLNIFFGVNILKFFYADPGWKNSYPGSGMEKIRIRDLGFTTLAMKNEFL
jgi:hypothetical protein